MTAGITTQVYRMQHDFIVDTKRYVGFLGGRNSGKTYAGSLKAIKNAAKGGLGCIAAPSFPQLEDGAKRQFLDRLYESGELFSKTRDGIIIPRFNAEIKFVTLESESRVRGPNFAWGWVDEVEYVTDRSIWSALKGAVRDGDNPELFVTSTPKGRRLVYDEWVVRKTDRHALYRATTFDNPFIDAEDYVSGLGYSGAFYEQEIDAEFISFEGLVYPRFDRARNIAVVDCTGWRTILGLDVGTRNPTALLTIRYAGDRIHVEREFYQRGLSSDSITDAAISAYQATKVDYLIIDPSAAGLIQSLKLRGIPTRKANNDVKIGISQLTTALESLTVDPSCTNLIDEFESYRYPTGGARDNSDSPVKEFDHALDALRYVIMDLVRPKGGLA